MKRGTRRSVKFVPVQRWAIAMIMVLLILGTLRETQSITDSIPNHIDELLSKDQATRDAGVKAILADRKKVVDALITLVDPANAGRYSEQTRSDAAYLLGKLRAPEAVPVLSKALVNEPSGPLVGSGVDDGRVAYPMWTALIRIGRPAIPAMIRNVETSADPVVRKHSVLVIGQVLGGKRRLLETLEKLKLKAKDDDTLRRLDEAYEWIHGAKETEDPLY